MKDLIAIIFVVISLTHSISAHPSDGLYLNDTTGMLIKLEKDTLQIYNLFLYNTTSWNDVWANPQARCIVNSVGQNIASINSIHPNFFDTMFDGVTIKVENNNTDNQKDSTEIIFRFPSLKNESVNVELLGSWNKKLKAKEKFGKCSFKEKRGENYFDFVVSPVDYMQFGNYNQYLGALFKRYNKEIKTDYRTISITIEVPNISDYTFAQYIIEDGYISYTDNTIKWQSLEFVRLTDNQIPEFTAAYEIWWANHLIMHNRFIGVSVPYYNINTP